MSTLQGKNKNHFFIPYIIIITLIITLQTRCTKDDDCEVPIIDSITFYDGTEKIDDLIPTKYISIHGQNLLDPSAIYLNSTPFNLNYVNISDTLISFIMPSTSSNDPDEELSDSIRIVKTCGEALRMVNILEAPPYITRISNEYAIASDTLIVEGYYFSLLEIANFIDLDTVVGEILPDYSDTACKIIVPDGNFEDFDLTLTSKSGSGASAYGIKFHPRTGLICNFDDLDTWLGYGGNVISANDDSSIPMANDDFFYGEANNIAPGTYNVETMKLPMEISNDFDFNGSLTPYYFAIKMEMFLMYPWKKGYYTIEIGEELDVNNIAYAYTYNYEPWNDTSIDGTYTTPRWETVTIPLNDFKLKENENIKLQSMSQIRTINYMFWNFSNPGPDETDSPETISEIGIALDNIRLVQIKSSE